jgi:thiamine biosynthesis protein ThiS
MELIINGAVKNFPDEMSVEKLIETLGVNKNFLVVEVNHEIIRLTDDQIKKKLNSGDQVELIQFVGGG